LELYLVSFAVLVGGGAAVGFALRGWALLAPPILAAALAYAWEFYGPALAYAAIAAFVATLGVALGILLRRRFANRSGRGDLLRKR
jgi:hypothetical protein